VRWIDNYLNLLQKKTAAATLADINAAARQIARQAARRSSAHRAVFRHLQEQQGRRNLISWAGAIGLGIEPQFSLYATDSVLTKAFEKGTGAASTPDPELELERMSVPRLRDILANATADQREQVRHDCRTISNLVALAETVDWRRVRTRLDVPRQSVSEGQGGPVVAFERLVSLWRSFSVRAMAIPYLIFVRGLPGYRYTLDDTFASKEVELRVLADIAAKTSGDAVAVRSLP
jgi:hypothetical protein